MNAPHTNPTKPSHSQRLWDWLINAYGLKPWGDNLLVGQAHFGLKAVASILTLVFLFEMITWGALANNFMHDGEWTVSWFTPIAIIIGSMPAVGVWLVDRSIMTIDTDHVRKSDDRFKQHLSESWNHLQNKEWWSCATNFLQGSFLWIRDLNWSFYTSIFGRVALVLLSALVTAASIELFIFKGEIKERFYQESIIAEAVRMVEEYEDSKHDAEVAADTDGNTLETASVQQAERLYQDARTDRDNKRAEVENLRTHVSQLQNLIRQKQAHLIQLQSTGGWVKPQQAQQELNATKAQLNQAEQNLSNAEVELEDLQERIRELEDRQIQTQDARVERRQSVESEVDQMRAWMDELGRGDANNLPTHPQTGKPLNLKEGGAVSKLVILHHILDGRGPRWPDTSTEIRTKVAQTFPGVAIVDEQNSEHKAATAAYMTWIYKVAHVIVVFIPLLTVLFKLMLPQELKDYYSTRKQALSGNNEADKLLKVRHGNEWYIKLVHEHRKGITP